METDALRAVADTLRLLENANYPKEQQDVTRPIGRMMATGAVVYDWCYPLLTAQQKKAYIDQLLRLAKELECGYPPRDGGSVTGHAFHQGSAYTETRFSSDLYPLFIFDRLGTGSVFNPSQQFVPYSWISMRRPDGQLLRSGDGQRRSPKLRALLIAS